MNLKISSQSLNSEAIEFAMVGVVADYVNDVLFPQELVEMGTLDTVRNENLRNHCSKKYVNLALITLTFGGI